MMTGITVGIALTLLVLGSSAEQNKNYGYDFTSDESSLEQLPQLTDIELDLSGTLRRQFAPNFLLRPGMQTAVCSPLAALICLGQLAMGAEGDSLTELLNAIGVPRKSQVKPYFEGLVTLLTGSPGVAITASNKIFITIKVHVLGKFDKDMAKIFSSNVMALHFEQIAYTKKKINRWIQSESTKKSAVDLDFKALIGRESAIVINVARISGSWNKPFRNIGELSFHTPNGVVDLPMMCRQGYYNYYTSYDLHAQLVEIPFVGKETTLVFILPFNSQGVDRVLERINKAPHMLNDALKNMTRTKTIVTLPKFSIHTSSDVESIYKSMGLQHIFQGNSGLSRIILNLQLIVQLAWQVSVFSINERGTEVTGPPLAELHRNQTQCTNIFNARHPFIFYAKYENEQLLVGTYSG